MDFNCGRELIGIYFLPIENVQKIKQYFNFEVIFSSCVFLFNVRKLLWNGWVKFWLKLIISSINFKYFSTILFVEYYCTKIVDTSGSNWKLHFPKLSIIKSFYTLAHETFKFSGIEQIFFNRVKSMKGLSRIDCFFIH